MNSSYELIMEEIVYCYHPTSAKGLCYLATMTTILFLCKTNCSTGIYLFKVNSNNGTRFEICSKLTIKTPERRHWCRSGVFIVNFEHISHLVQVFLLLTLNKYLPAGWSTCKYVVSDVLSNLKFKRYVAIKHLWWSFFAKNSSRLKTPR